jgi:molecular chaperone GrpE
MSEENKTEKANSNANQTDKPEGIEENQKVQNDSKDESALLNQLKEKEKELLYLRAEFDNFKKHSIKERSDILRYAGEMMARDMLNTLDVFEKALDQEVTEENYKNFVEGIRLTATQLKSDLKKHGIEEIDCKGKPFDPNTCEALSQIPDPNAKEGEVLEVMRKGFMFRDKVLRYAQVVTASAPKTDN